ncbi:MAG: hypothetical protein RLZ85_1269 [Verrucomicrobiota bacterium]
MIYASLRCLDFKDNELFRPGKGRNNGEFFLPYGQLREGFLAEGIELNTPDVNVGRPVSFEFHINAQRRTPEGRAYVYLYENPLIRPLNRDMRILAGYDRWFGWDEYLAADPRFVRVSYPNAFPSGVPAGPEARPLFCVLVASNKALMTVDERDQYAERVRIIDWYERNAPGDFHLYGKGWEVRAPRAGRWGRLLGKAAKFMAKFGPPRSPYATWHGMVDDKIGLLGMSRFCLAHENCRDLPGYVTEKLFDCFRAGCVPVYVGPKEIRELVPAECFIDGRDFPDPAALHAYLRSVDDERYLRYQRAAQDYFASGKADRFGRPHFVESIVKGVVADLMRQA